MSVSDPRHWVIGRGLLGSAVDRALEQRSMSHPIDWTDEGRAVAALREGLARLIESSPGEWSVYWCAGAGVTATPASALEQENRVFAQFLDEIARLPLATRERGALFLASSVGGAYAGNPKPPFTERSSTTPLSAYGEAKLRMEDRVRALSETAGVRTFVARVTNLYGPGQDLSKGQGLISVIARTYLTNQPASIFVSLDTIRDYIFVDDCAAVVVTAMRRVLASAPGTHIVKIVGSSQAVSIGALIGEFGRLMRRRPLIILGAGDARGQALDLRVRSVVWPDLDALVTTSLPEGISRTYRSLLLSTVAPAGANRLSS